MTMTPHELQPLTSRACLNRRNRSRRASGSSVVSRMGMFWAVLVSILGMVGVGTPLLAAEKSAQAATKSSGASFTSDVKTIQRKTFLKAKRFEFTPYLGTETVDIFMHHYVAGVSGTYHLTEVFAVEGLVAFSPSLTNIGKALNMPDANNFDLKDLTIELAEGASVKPISSKIGAYGGAAMVFSPFYGKLAFLSRNIVAFDLYFMFGPGFIQTQDRDSSYDSGGTPFSTTDETHLTSHFGFGFRAAFNDWMALKIEGREYIYIENVTRGEVAGSEDTAVKYYFMTQAGLSFFFGQTGRSTTQSGR